MRKSVHRAAALLAKRSDPSPPEVIEQVIKKYPTIKPDQAEAVRYLCSGGNLRLCVGDAGTGKSFMLGVCREIWEAEGRKVYGCALPGAATGGASTSNPASRATPSTERSTRFDRGEIKLDSRSVVVLDEAGMVGSRLFHRLAREVVKADCRFVCVGDPKQLAPIEAGWIFKRMAEVHRQNLAQDQYPPGEGPLDA